jgi:hypothetical protein
MKRYKVYIAAPFTAANGEELKRNVDHANELQGMVLALALREGYPVIPVCPQVQFVYFDRTYTAEDWYGITLDQLDDCDAVLLSQFWRLSRGATSEREHAYKLGKPLFYDITEVRAWLSDVTSTARSLAHGG